MTKPSISIKGFEVDGIVGQGGMCQVYGGQQLSTGKRVAIKVLLPELAEDQVQRDRFLREGRNMASLSHANIVEVYEVGQIKEGPYIVMEFIEGSTLRDLLDEGADAGSVLAICEDIASVLHFAHNKGYLHRDLKPDNILISKNGITKVADWGLSKSIEDTSGITKTGVVLGTPAYMAPEQILGRELEGSVDLYALGVILFEAFAGQHPFDNSNITKLLSEQLTKNPPSLFDFDPALPRPLVRLIEQLLEKKEENRPASGEKVAKELKNLAQNWKRKVQRPAKTSLNSAVTQNKLKSRDEPETQKRSPIAALALMLLIVCSGLWLHFQGSVKDRTSREAVFKLATLRNLNELTLRYDVFEPTTIEITFSPIQALDPLPYSTKEYELLPSPSARGRLRNLPIKFTPALTQPLKIVVMSKRQKNRKWTFVIDPKELIDELFKPIDKLSKNLTPLAVDLDRLRVQLEGARKGIPKSFHEEYKKHEAKLFQQLDNSGFSQYEISQIDEYLQSALPNNILPGTPIARRLLPLRHVERALSEHMGLKPPWQPIFRSLGFRHKEGFLKPVKAPWRRLVHLDLTTPKNNKLMWLWLGQKSFIKGIRRSSFFALTTLDEVKKQLQERHGQWDDEKEYFPTPNELQLELIRSFDMEKPADKQWPPDKVLIRFVTKNFARHNELLFNINGQGPVSALNISLLDWYGNTGRSSLSTMTVSFPIPPQWLLIGKNTIKLETVTAAGETAIAPLCFSDIVIDCYFGDQK